MGTWLDLLLCVGKSCPCKASLCSRGVWVIYGAALSSTLKMWDVCVLRLVSWLDILHKHEFERGEKKH